MSNKIGDTRWQNTVAYVLAQNKAMNAGQCRIKGPKCTGEATTVDHIIPRAVGGTNELTNLRAACEKCNYGRPKPWLEYEPEHKQISKW